MNVAQAVLPPAGMSGVFCTLDDRGWHPHHMDTGDRNSLLVLPLDNPFPKSFK